MDDLSDDQYAFLDGLDFTLFPELDVNNETNFYILEPQKDPIEEALELNTKLQEEVKFQILKLTSLCMKNEMEQAELQETTEKRNEKKPSKKLQSLTRVFGRPYFQDIDGRCCPENKDAIEKRRQGIFCNAYFKPPKDWSQREIKTLEQSIYESVTKDKMDESEISEAARKEILSKADHIDWLAVSVKMKARDAEECELMWNNCTRPSLNTSPFTRDENYHLKNLAKQYGRQNWDEIAKKLRTNRSEYQVFEHYQRELNEDLIKTFWTRDEDKKLRQTIVQCRKGDYIPWIQVTNVMEGRTFKQVTNRWERMLKSESTTRPWSAEEDAVLYAVALKYPDSWVKTAEFLPQQTKDTCRVRYLSVLKPNIVSGGWSLEEDRLLIQKMVEIDNKPGKWIQIEKCLPGRSRYTTYNRAKKLRESNLKAFEFSMEKCRQGHPPEKFMPSQIVTTNCRPTRNSHHDEAQRIAAHTFVSAAKEKCDLTFSMDNDLLHEEIKDMTYNHLKEISKFLLRHVTLDKSLKGNAQYSIVEAKDDNSSYDSDEHTEEESEEKLKMSEEELAEMEQRVNNELDVLMHPRAYLGLMYKRNPTRMISSHAFEYSTLLSHLLQVFDAKTDIPIEESKESFNLKESLKRVLDILVFPPSHDMSFPIIPPNDTTMTQAMILFVTRAIHLDVLEHDFPKPIQWNLQLLHTVKNKSDVICYFCNQGKEFPKVCNCDKLRCAFDRFLLFRKRFMAINLWPGLLSRIAPTDNQLQNLIFRHPRLLVEKPIKRKCDIENGDEDIICLN